MILMFFIKPLVADIEKSVYGNSEEIHRQLRDGAGVDLILSDLFKTRDMWDQMFGSSTSPLVVLASGLAPRVSNYHRESPIPTGVFQPACFEALKLQFPSSIIILSHTGAKTNLGYMTGDAVWHGPVNTDEKPFPNCPDICLSNLSFLRGEKAAKIRSRHLLPNTCFESGDGSLLINRALLFSDSPHLLVVAAKGVIKSFTLQHKS